LLEVIGFKPALKSHLLKMRRVHRTQASQLETGQISIRVLLQHTTDARERARYWEMLALCESIPAKCRGVADCADALLRLSELSDEAAAEGFLDLMIKMKESGLVAELRQLVTLAEGIVVHDRNAS
jgi:hypothetical protein